MGVYQRGVQAWSDIIIMLFGQITQRACGLEGKREEAEARWVAGARVQVRSSEELI